MPVLKLHLIIAKFQRIDRYGSEMVWCWKRAIQIWTMIFNVIINTSSHSYSIQHNKTTVHFFRSTIYLSNAWSHFFARNIDITICKPFWFGYNFRSTNFKLKQNRKICMDRKQIKYPVKYSWTEFNKSNKLKPICQMARPVLDYNILL